KFFLRVLYFFCNVSLGSTSIGSRRFGNQKFAFAKFFHALFQIFLLLAGDCLVVIVCVGAQFFTVALFNRHCSLPLRSLISRTGLSSPNRGEGRPNPRPSCRLE